jgi:DOPA 4,5-dioxygenase
MNGSPDALHGYHAHIYYDDDTFPIAAKLRDKLAADFPVQIGRNAGVAGPHPVPQIQIIFRNEAFQRVVPWLMLNRDELDVLVHPLAGNAYDDHTVYAMWLGDKLPLRLDVLKRVSARL